MKYTISISGNHYDELRNHLYPGDTREAVAIALCGRLEEGQRIKLLVNEIISIPYEKCSVREEDMITWSTEHIIPSLLKANKHGFSVMKIHCHPKGGEYFSKQDNRSDHDLFPSIFGWIDNAPVHASCIMLPDGKIFGRVFNQQMDIISVDTVTCISDNVKIWNNIKIKHSTKEFDLRNRQAFGEGTVSTLKKMKVAVIGCSGTGSIVIEQLVRLGVGELLIIDPDIVEIKNLNRILNSSYDDAINQYKKVDVLKKAADKVGFGTVITPIARDIYSDVSIIRSIASTDFIFGCVDSIDARHLLNQIASFYLIPYLDLGVYLKSDGQGGVSYITGSVHYLKPGGASLLTRSVYTSEEIRAVLMCKFDPESFKENKKAKYIKDVNIDSPAVISVNMQISAIAINEFLAKIHGFRGEDSDQYAIVRMDILNNYMQNETDGSPDEYLLKYIGRGDNINPFLNMPIFS